MWFIVCPFLSYSAMAIFPFILIKDAAYKNNPSLVFHERIHHRQQLELLIIPFYLLYLLNYLYNLLKYKNHDLAYRNIIFEREAYTMDKNYDYLIYRPFWNFLKF